jgi:hypothetical protein
MSDRPTSGRPDSPGLWEREGKFYRVWKSDFIYAEEVLPDGHLARDVRCDRGSFSCAPIPTGNWRKLEPGAGEGEPDWYDLILQSLPQDMRQNLTAGVLEGVQRLAADWRQLVDENHKLRHGTAPPTPAVIEGNGQPVTEADLSHWLVIIAGGCTPVVRFMGLRDAFNVGYRYMRCPEFPPPRAAFVAPERPELVLIQYDGEEPDWIFARDVDNAKRQGAKVLTQTGEPERT